MEQITVTHPRLLDVDFTQLLSLQEDVRYTNLSIKEGF